MRTLSCLLIVLLLALVACTPDEIVPEESVVSAPINVTRVTSTLEVVVATATAVSPTTTTTLAATATPTILPATISPTIRPTATSRPTETPTPTITPLPTHYDLPAWLNDPETAVLMALLRPVPYPESYSETSMLTFINVSSGEQFLFPISLYEFVSNWAWGHDDKGLYFEFIQNEDVQVAFNTFSFIPKYIHRIYLADGAAITLPSDTPPGLTQRSPNNRYLTRIIRDREKGELTITIENPNISQIINLIDPFSGQFGSHTEMLWSSTSDLVAVIHYAFGEPGEPPAVATIIYSLDGAIYRQNSNLFAWAWAPDDSYRMLYVEGEGYGYYSPCIWEVQTNTHSCLSEVATWAEENNVKVDGYQWALNNQQIEFTYRGAASRASGLCKIEIENRAIACLLDDSDLGEPDSHGYINYILDPRSWSPDGQYLTFVNGPEGDDALYFQVATIANDGSQFQTWGYGDEAFWRPPVNP